MGFSTFTLSVKEGSAFGSNRYEAIPVRKQLENFLAEHGTATIDFQHIPKATQSWVDEVVGKFVLKEGAAFLKQVKFQNCTPVIQEIIRFVVTDRMRDYEEQQQRMRSPSMMPNHGIIC
jgi:hypothetical protein